MYEDFSFSFGWAFMQVVIVFGVALGVTHLGITKLLPSLDVYHMHSRMKESDIENPDSDDEYYQQKVIYMEGLFEKQSVVFIAAEDGLICVPVLLIGLSPITAVLAGIVFGWLHLPRFTYFECLIKSITYTIVCLLVLPKGILTVVVGHYLTDGFGWLVLKFTKKYINKLESPNKANKL